MSKFIGEICMIYLSKNEKKMLNILLDDGSKNDTEIASQLNVSSQAIGKIRKNLEEKLIKNYHVGLDILGLGLNAFALIKIRLNPNVKIKDISEIEKNLIDIPEVVSFFRTFSGQNEHILLVGFPGIEEIDNFINSRLKLKHEWMIMEVTPFSSKSVLKNSTKDLFKQLINQQNFQESKF